MGFRDWLDIIVLGLFSIVGGWMKGEHSQIKKRIENLEKNDSEINTKLAIIETKQESNQEHIDRRFDGIEKKFDALFDRFNQYDEDRANFFKEFDLKRKQ